ncbi:MAG: hypothetical protein Kow0029_04640 [Candidatus Rifleibacteriota bacterium]
MKAWRRLITLASSISSTAICEFPRLRCNATVFASNETVRNDMAVKEINRKINDRDLLSSG